MEEDGSWSEEFSADDGDSGCEVELEPDDSGSLHDDEDDVDDWLLPTAYFKWISSSEDFTYIVQCNLMTVTNHKPVP